MYLSKLDNVKFIINPDININHTTKKKIVVIHSSSILKALFGKHVDVSAIYLKPFILNNLTIYIKPFINLRHSCSYTVTDLLTVLNKTVINK